MPRLALVNVMWACTCGAVRMGAMWESQYEAEKAAWDQVHTNHGHYPCSVWLAECIWLGIEPWRAVEDMRRRYKDMEQGGMR